MADRTQKVVVPPAGGPAAAVVVATRQKNHDRTCCNLCHIKFGTAFLGLIEALIAVSLLIGALGHVLYKKEDSALCKNTIFRDCLIFKFSYFNITLIFDYLVIIMMIFILFSVICLFCGVFSDTSCLILPHIIVQGIFLIFSLGYFFLYALSYFYDDLIVKGRKFQFQSMFERMWLATLLLALAGLQSYLFSSVIRCSLYLADIEENRRRRESAFERCSERVRIAKENGLWRTTSWGGGFQQYKGQYDRPKKEVKNKGFHVQWNTDLEAQKTEEKRKKDMDLEMGIIEAAPPLSPIPEDEIKETVKKPAKIRTPSHSEERRSSTHSTTSQHNVMTAARGITESPKKERPRSVKKTSSEGASRLEEEVKKHHHHHREHLTSEGKPSPSLPKKYVNVTLKQAESTRETAKTRRPSLKKNKSVDSGDNFDEVVAFYKEKHHRRRSSDHGHNFRSKSSSSPEKKDVPIVKKVSITTAPLFP